MPGFAAEPVIDMMGGARRLHDGLAARTALADLGYQLIETDRSFFHRSTAFPANSSAPATSSTAGTASSPSPVTITAPDEPAAASVGRGRAGGTAVLPDVAPIRAAQLLMTPMAR